MQYGWLIISIDAFTSKLLYKFSENPLKFNIDKNDIENNSTILKKHGFNINRLILAYQASVIDCGSNLGFQIP